MISVNVGRGFCCQLFDLDYVSLILPTREIANFSLIEEIAREKTSIRGTRKNDLRK
jgi:hypothetical protein